MNIKSVSKYYSSGGLVKVLSVALKKIKDAFFDNLGYCFSKLFFKNTFIFRGKALRYLVRRHNHTWKCERAIEVPVALAFCEEYKNKNVLEIGNVLTHYFVPKGFENYVIVDKFEQAKGIINKDIIDFKSKIKFDFIFSVSTFEHIGFDEQEGTKTKYSPKKIGLAINKVKKMLGKDGIALITLPIDYNPWLDCMLLNENIKFDELWCYKHVSRYGWGKVELSEALLSKYNYPFCFGNALVVGIIKN